MKNTLFLLLLTILLGCGGTLTTDSDAVGADHEVDCGENLVSFTVNIGGQEISVEDFVPSSVSVNKSMGLEFSMLNFQASNHNRINLENGQYQIFLTIQPSGVNPPEITTGKYETQYITGDMIFCHFRVKTHEGASTFQSSYINDKSTGFVEIKYLSDDFVCCHFDITDAFGQKLKGKISGSTKNIR